MTELPYPITREAERLRRWLETAGAERRLVLAVCATEALRARVEEEIGANGRIDVAPLDLAATDLGPGDVVPPVFRDHRGTHTSYRLYVFRGLGARVRAEGKAPLEALDRAEALFKRPATWALVWLDDPALVELVRRVAPRFHAAVELHPTFADPTLFDPAGTPGAIRSLLAACLPVGRSAGTDPSLAARLLLDRGSLLEAMKLLREAPFAAEPLLLAAAEAELLAGDPQRALAHLAAASAYGGRFRAEALAGSAAVLARLGDRRLAADLLEQAQAATASAPDDDRAAARVTIARASLLGMSLDATPAEDGSGGPRGAQGGRGAPSGPFAAVAARDAVARARDAAGKDARLLARLAEAVEREGASADLALEIRTEAVSAAGGGGALRTLLEADLGLAIARATALDDAARPFLERALAQEPRGVAGVRARRGLARLLLARAVETGAADGVAKDLLAEAQTLLEQALADALSQGLTIDALECHWERVSLEAAREDLGGVLAALEAVREAARAAGLRPVAFDALEKHARALRFARELARASGELDALESMALDLTWPDLEARAFDARGDHLAELGLAGEARTSYTRALGIALAAGRADLAAEIEGKRALLGSAS